MAIIRLDYDGSAPQAKFWESEKKFRAFVGGIGSGKTFAGAMAILREKPSAGMVITPIEAMALEPIRTIKRIAQPLIVEEKRGNGEKYIRLSSGHEMYFRSAENPERLRGPNLGWFWIDEAAQIKDNSIWLVMIGRLRMNPGRGWITSTPKGFNWLYKTFVTEMSLHTELVKATSDSNKFHENKGFFDSVSGIYNGNFKAQELEGEFVSLTEGLVKLEDIQVGFRSYEIGEGKRVMGVDLAITKKEGADYTACVVMEQGEDGKIYVIDVSRVRCEFNDVIKFIENVALMYHPSIIGIEKVAYQTAIIQELLRKTSLPIYGITPDRDKVTRFLPVAMKYNNKQIFHSRENVQEWFDSELLTFPNTKYDDGIDAISYAYIALNFESEYKTKNRSIFNERD